VQGFFVCYCAGMKADTHPTYFAEAKITCACGRSFTVGSTKEKLEIEICSNCHPFYTGNEKILDAAGRVEKFKARRAAAKK
jgi:large subunit ribosomal protein L31